MIVGIMMTIVGIIMVGMGRVALSWSGWKGLGPLPQEEAKILVKHHPTSHHLVMIMGTIMVVIAVVGMVVVVFSM